MGSGKRPAAPPIVEPIAVADTIANGVSVYDDGLITWMTFWAERVAALGREPERVVTSKVCVPSAQYPKLLRMLGALPPVTYIGDGGGMQ